VIIYCTRGIDLVAWWWYRVAGKARAGRGKHVTSWGRESKSSRAGRSRSSAAGRRAPFAQSSCSRGARRWPSPSGRLPKARSARHLQLENLAWRLTLLLDDAQPAEHVRDAEREHVVRARLLLPELEPRLRAAVLVPRRAAVGRVLERGRLGAERLPRAGERVVAREEAVVLRAVSGCGGRWDG
jgi:hypothetical protein